MHLGPLALDPRRPFAQRSRRVGRVAPQPRVERDAIRHPLRRDLERHVLDHGRGSRLVSTASNALPGTSWRVWSWSFDQLLCGAPDTYHDEPLSARIIP